MDGMHRRTILGADFGTSAAEMNFEQMLKGLFGAAMAADMAADLKRPMPKQRRMERIKFDTEAHALKHAAALAVLQPGAEILIKAKGEDAQRAVFMGRENARADVMVYDDEQELCMKSVPVGAIRFLA